MNISKCPSTDFYFDKSLDYYRHQNILGGDLRVSITSDCNMRCFYCHNEGQGIFVNKFMTIEALRSIVMMGIKFGVSKVRLTGGEPSLHPELIEMINMLKKDLVVRNVGINTNGMMLDSHLLNKLVESKLDVMVVGLDYFDSAISKNSPIGKSSEEIINNITIAKRMGLVVQIASVYDGSNLNDIVCLVKWCKDNNILFKVLELSDNNVVSKTSIKFVDLIKLLCKNFGLRLGKTMALNEIFGIHNNGSKILFFHSHCRIRECYECSQIHMRVTVNGNAKPCILRTNTEQCLIGINSEESMRRAIHNLGNPPERAPI